MIVEKAIVIGTPVMMDSARPKAALIFPCRVGYS